MANWGVDGLPGSGGTAAAQVAWIEHGVSDLFSALRLGLSGSAYAAFRGGHRGPHKRTGKAHRSAFC